MAERNLLVPPEGDTYWGAWVPDVPWEMTAQDAFEQAVGKRASIIHWGQAWYQGGKAQPFWPGDHQRVRDRGAIGLLDWGSWDLWQQSASDPSVPLQSILAGQHDDHIRRWASGAAAWGKPFYLRFDWEMNGGWFPWGREAAADPARFVAVWRHVHQLVTSEGATNAVWVWCPNTVFSGSTPLDDLYPGHDVVDWLGFDAYNFGDEDWKSPRELLRPTAWELYSLAPDKPVMLAEWGCSEDGGSKATWLRHFFNNVHWLVPNLRALVHFNWNAGDPGLTWPVDSSPAALDAFRRGIARRRFRATI